MITTIGSSSGTPEAGEATPEQTKKRIPLMAIPITLSIGLLVGVVYVGNRVFASRTHATAVVASSLMRSEPAPSAAAPILIPKPTPFAPVQTPAPAPVAVPVAAAATVPERPAAIPERKDETPAAKPLLEVRTSVSTPASTGETQAAPNDGVEFIAPQHGERYLQIAAIGSHMVPKFLSDLNRYHLQANVAPGPHDGLVRVVIGPFPDRESIAQAKAQIEANWPDCFVRLY
jgi:cell division septation protein DedD